MLGISDNGGRVVIGLAPRALGAVFCLGEDAVRFLLRLAKSLRRALAEFVALLPEVGDLRGRLREQLLGLLRGLLVGDATLFLGFASHAREFGLEFEPGGLGGFVEFGIERIPREIEFVLHGRALIGNLPLQGVTLRRDFALESLVLCRHLAFEGRMLGSDLLLECVTLGRDLLVDFLSTARGIFTQVRLVGFGVACDRGAKFCVRIGELGSLGPRGRNLAVNLDPQGGSGLFGFAPQSGSFALGASDNLARLVVRPDENRARLALGGCDELFRPLARAVGHVVSRAASSLEPAGGGRFGILRHARRALIGLARHALGMPRCRVARGGRVVLRLADELPRLLFGDLERRLQLGSEPGKSGGSDLVEFLLEISHARTQRLNLVGVLTCAGARLRELAAQVGDRAVDLFAVVTPHRSAELGRLWHAICSFDRDGKRGALAHTPRFWESRVDRRHCGGGAPDCLSRAIPGNFGGCPCSRPRSSTSRHPDALLLPSEGGRRQSVRFVLAIISFVVSAVLIVFGLIQQSVENRNANNDFQVSTSDAGHYILITGETLNSRNGVQRISVPNASDDTVVAYGKTEEVRAWLGSSPYGEIESNGVTGDLTLTKHSGRTAATPSATPTANNGDADSTSDGHGMTPDLVNPKGSDLWLGEYDGEKTKDVRLHLPDNVSVLIANNGEKAAPAKVGLSWPRSAVSPVPTVLLILGALVFVLGVILYILALRHLRRSTGPRRTPPPGEKRAPRPVRGGRARRGALAGDDEEPRPIGRGSHAVGDDDHETDADARAVNGGSRDEIESSDSVKTNETEKNDVGSKTERRALPLRKRYVIAMATAGVAGLALSGCATQGGTAPSASSSATSTDGDKTAPDLTQAQARSIITSVRETAAKADAEKNADAASARFAGAALDARRAQYTIQQKDGGQPGPLAVPDGEISIILPQQTDSWPRTLFSVVSPKDTKQAPVAMTLVQSSPRAAFKVVNMVQLQANVGIPEVPSASDGSVRIANDTKFLQIAPSKLVAAYGDVIAQNNTTDAQKFDTQKDKLQAAINKQAHRDSEQQKVQNQATIDFTTSQGQNAPIALSTNESGALVATEMVETETIKPKTGNDSVNAGDQGKLLSGIGDSKKGIETTYTDQLLFYVPAAGSADKIELVGFVRQITAQKEL